MLAYQCSNRNERLPKLEFAHVEAVVVEECAVASEAGQQEKAEVDGEGEAHSKQRPLWDGLRRLTEIAGKVGTCHDASHLLSHLRCFRT